MDTTITVSTDLDTSSHFFRLPGEIRNAIYEYALSAPNGAIYREVNGVGKLCSQEDYREKARIQVQLQKEEVQLGTGMHVTTFLQLACESLTPSSYGIPRAPNGPLHEINLLKYVNRQLYAETRRLTVVHNDVTIIGSSMSDLLGRCASFLSSIAAPQRHKIRNVVLKSTCRESYAVILDGHNAVALTKPLAEKDTDQFVRHFCTEYPKTTIKIYFPWLTRRIDRGVTLMMPLVALSVALRNELALAKKLAAGNVWLEERIMEAACIRPATNYVHQYPDNIRFFPWHEGTYEALLNGLAFEGFAYE